MAGKHKFHAKKKLSPAHSLLPSGSFESCEATHFSPSSSISGYEKWLLMSELHFPFNLISALHAGEPIIFFTFQNSHSTHISQSPL